MIRHPHVQELMGDHKVLKPSFFVDRTQINDRLGRMAGNGHRVLDRLYEKPIVSVEDVRAITGTTFQAANVIVQRPVGLGVLHEMTGRARNRRFLYAPYVNLFN